MGSWNSSEIFSSWDSSRSLEDGRPNPTSSESGGVQYPFKFDHSRVSYPDKYSSSETANWFDDPPAEPIVCQVCGIEFASDEDLRAHQFDGHVTIRPVLLLRGRECGRSRLQVLKSTHPSDWKTHHATSAHVNGSKVAIAKLGEVLSNAQSGVTTVQLHGDRADQDFEFSFSFANDSDLFGVDRCLGELLAGRLLTVNTIDQFIVRSRQFQTTRTYVDGLASYFFGVLARERSPESGLQDRATPTRTYLEKFDEAVSALSQFERPAAEAICGLVSFHYNHFETAMRKTRSARVSQISHRFAKLLRGDRDIDQSPIPSLTGLDFQLSDSETERVLSWCCVPLDGSAGKIASDMSRSIQRLEPLDQTKVRVLLVEHYLSAGDFTAASDHLSALKHSSMMDTWVASIRERSRGKIR
jgi:hypothetical protein